MPRTLKEYARRPVNLDEYAKRAGQVNPAFKAEERGIVQTMDGVERGGEGGGDDIIVDGAEDGAVKEARQLGSARQTARKPVSSDGVALTDPIGDGLEHGRPPKSVSDGEWRNKRAEEEYARAYDLVVDRDFNMDDLGDPFLEPGAIEKFRALCGKGVI